MSISRRQLLHLTASATALVTVPRVAWGQGYPSRPITMVVPYAAGGPTDVIGRIVAEGMRASLGQPIIIEDVGGANGSIGVGRVARAVERTDDFYSHGMVAVGQPGFLEKGRVIDGVAVAPSVIEQFVIALHLRARQFLGPDKAGQRRRGEEAA